jgi:pantoate--beta-alanine ligase
MLSDRLLANIIRLGIFSVSNLQSSRNRLLSEEERKDSIDIYHALLTAKRKLIDGESVASVQNHITNYFKMESKIELEYFEIVNTADLQKITVFRDKIEVSLCIAGHLGNVRLIDNISLN